MRSRRCSTCRSPRRTSTRTRTRTRRSRRRALPSGATGGTAGRVRGAPPIWGWARRVAALQAFCHDPRRRGGRFPTLSMADYVRFRVVRAGADRRGGARSSSRPRICRGSCARPAPGCARRAPSRTNSRAISSRWCATPNSTRCAKRSPRRRSFNVDETIARTIDPAGELQDVLGDHSAGRRWHPSRRCCRQPATPRRARGSTRPGQDDRARACTCTRTASDRLNLAQADERKRGGTRGRQHAAARSSDRAAQTPRLFVHRVPHCMFAPVLVFRQADLQFPGHAALPRDGRSRRSASHLHRSHRGVLHRSAGRVLGRVLPCLPGHRDTDLAVRGARPLPQRAQGVPALSHRHAAALHPGRLARLLRHLSGRLALLPELSDAGRQRHSADRARAQGERVPDAGDAPHARLRAGVSASGAADADGAGRAGDVAVACVEAPLCHRRRLRRRRGADAARHLQPGLARRPAAGAVRDLDLLLQDGREEARRARGRPRRPRRQIRRRRNRYVAGRRCHRRERARPI